MQIKLYFKKITILLISFLFIFSIVVFSGLNGENNIAYSEPDTSSDAGVLDMCDDFRYTGLNKNKTKSYYYSYNNVSTGDYGSYTYGLTPTSQFANEVDVGNGEIVYEFSLDGNGVFFLIRSLYLTVEYELLSSYSSSLTVSYKVDNGEYVPVELSSGIPGFFSFNEILNDLLMHPETLYSKTLYVKISLNHESADNIPLNEVSIRLYSVKFNGMQNFTMKKGARLKLANSYYPDLSFRTYIAKDVYDKLIEKYDESYDMLLGNIIMPADFIKLYNASLYRENIEFKDGEVLVGDYKPGLKIVGNTISDYTVTVNGVTYYYYDGLVRLGNAYYTKDFIGKAYIRILDGNKNEVFFSFASYNNQDISENSRSTVYCAQKLIEKNSYLTDRLNKIYINSIKDEFLSSKYTVRQFYIGTDYNVVEVKETTYISNINNKIVSLPGVDKYGYSAAKNGVIIDGEKIIYKNTEYDRVYPLGKSVINLYYIANS